MIISCPECQNQFYVQNDQAEQIVKCSRCEKEIKVLGPEPENSDDDLIVSPLPSRQPASTDIRWIRTLNDNLNLKEGLKRFTLVTSLVFGPIVYVTIMAKDYYTLQARFNEQVDTYLRIGILWAIGFVGTWLMYLISSILVSVFNIGQGRLTRKPIIKPLLVLTVISLLPLVPAVFNSIDYVSSQPIWYKEDLWKFFLPWPIIGFCAVWGSFFGTLFIGRGFRYQRHQKSIEDVRKSQTFSHRPQESAAGWRTT